MVTLALTATPREDQRILFRGMAQADSGNVGWHDEQFRHRAAESWEDVE